MWVSYLPSKAEYVLATLESQGCDVILCNTKTPIVEWRVKCSVKENFDNVAQLIVNELESDGDGQLTAEEAVSYGLPMSVFTSMDYDGNGYVTSAELARWFRTNV